MVQDKLKQDKIKIWRDKLEALDKEYKETMQQRGEAAAMGDLRENIAYQMATEKGEVLSARMSDIQKMIRELEDGKA
ncbi:MAG: hypothetical protein ACD_30C00001G0001 [uncultured bacterium]|uniref:Transcription elongation factor GreA/GreB N-terminal domain-containing protein n=4 Tax=Candidatus Daviesiibacteriota TaxID=1752718 RepID=A0A0G0HE50_9BACT|nr:MAG: hypothetical protein ACD_30C00001G0001 [uncultured bacterium]KKQ10389.1 MAG: hypothetical protein US19_C0005G0001 [Candidatus Daviesbacteria bacterium GW2011_GWB1_36_5]KKQ15768.1 MAG: hypothetical protein US28_C0010G0001 [Candidatus Daviesbacteria bacterium GW2011_GWA1_36_8]OGE16550.1 MAG: hypothetical protein A2858_01745 [Candidatus Daviesbacteria bacterium RIFCSPHIGHO2_01_FULL_36_37]OGE31767.1 MAG: hypothetical protein A3C99_03055 [Candidatus Daviesbacteria bacterium RIFCSPHIGHO2_02_F